MVNRSSSQLLTAQSSFVTHGSSTAGYAAPTFMLGDKTEEDKVALTQLAAKILQDPLAMRRLSDRVFQLLQEDLQLQQERNRGYGRRRA